MGDYPETGWGVTDGSRIRREYSITQGRIEGHGRRGKALTADYVLEYRNTRLAVAEAKAFDEALTEGVAQAKNYAAKMALRFAYATNGQGIYQIDMQTGAEGEVARYPTPDELWNLTFAETSAPGATASLLCLSRIAADRIRAAIIRILRSIAYCRPSRMISSEFC